MLEVERVRKCLKGFRTEALPELNRMVNKDFNDNTIEALLEELVEVAVVGQEDCAVQAQIVLAESYRHITEKNKENIINWILAYTEKYIDDIMIIFLGFNLLLKLDWKELYVKYIGLYDELIKKEFDDDYIQFYEIEQYLK